MPFPVYSDDNGDGQSGTILDSQFLDDIAGAIADVQVSSDAVLAEVIAARGSESSLDDRLDVSINEDGTLKQASVQGLVGISNGVNLVGNDTFLDWPLGDASAPAYWVVAGAGAAVARTGTGLGDTNRKWGRYAAKVTCGAGATGTLYQELVNSTDIGFAQALAGRKISFGARVKCSVANIACMRFDDGSASATTEFHSGETTTGPEGDGWEWLSAVHTVGNGPSTLRIICSVSPVGGAQSAYFSGVTVLFDEIVPVDWLPALVTRKVFHHYGAGAQTTGVKAYFNVDRPAVIRAATAYLNTVPTGTTFVVDVAVADGAAGFASIYAGAGTRVIIATNERSGAALPDGTYQRRCLQTAFQTGATPAAGTIVRIEVTQIGGGVAGSDLSVDVYYECWNRPLDELLLS